VADQPHGLVLSGRTALMDVKKKIAGSAFGVLALAGIGAGVANAATTTAPPPAASTSSAADTPTPGDAPDVPGAVNGGNTQQGDQTTPDVPGAPAGN